MDLGNLKPASGSRSKERRLGRGTSAGQGRTSGKGHKGQKARSGFKYNPGFEGGQMPIQRRLPKRGFSNAPFRKIYQIVNLKQLSEVFTAGQEVNPEMLLKQGLISKASLPVKVLGDGDITVALKMRVHAASQSATEKITAAGGEVQLL
ncbi:MAG: 50S ribosomal protein L15 [Candidatus Zixiibacteriota bacterium]|nr:MAG: 50S ribosomal protein L15 [candidate division Zixibacteria bacterium]